MKRLVLLFVMLNSIQHLTLAQNRTIDSLLHIINSSPLRGGAGADTSKINALNAITREYLNTGDYELAISYAEKAETLAKTLGFKKGVANALNNQGAIYVDQSDYSKALDYYLRSLKISEEIGHKKGISGSLGNIGLIYKHQGDYPKALDYFLRSLKIREEIGDNMGIASSLNNIGIIYYIQGNYPKALDFYLRSLKIKENIGDKKGIPSSLNNIGNIFGSQGDYPKALNYYLRSLKIREEIGDKKGIAAILNNIGNIYILQGDYPKALDYNLRSLKIQDEIGDKEGIANSFINLGSAYFQTGNTALAIDYGIKGLALSNEIKSLEFIKEANKFLSEAYQKTNQHQKALEYYKAFIIARDSLFNEENTKKLVQSELKFDYEKKEQATKLGQEKKDAIALEEREKQKIIRNSFMGGFALLLLLSVAIFKSYRNKKKANELISLQKKEVENQKHIIEEKQKDILDSIHYAKRIQDALLKEEQHASNHLPEHFILFKPKDIISGDFYWALEKQGHLYLAAADCTGHGVPGAMMSMLGIAFLNEITGIEYLLSPAEILNRLRDKVVKELSSSGQTKDGMDISLCKINLKTTELEWAGANNPLWCIRKLHCEDDSLKQSQTSGEIASLPRNDGYELIEIKADKQPIGYSDVYKPFTNHTFTEKDCIYYLFTDGYADQFGGSNGKKFKYKPLQEKLINLSGVTLDIQKNELNTIFDLWKGDLEQVDDVCVIGVRIV